MKRANFKSVTLNPVHQKKWDETLAAANWVMPHCIHLLYSMMVPKGRKMAALFTEEMPKNVYAATDGFQIIFKPSEYFELPLMQRVFAVGHEVMHNVFDHCGVGYRLRKQGIVTWEGRTLPYDPGLANIVQDLIINDGLIESRIGEFNAAWLHDTSIATYKDSWIEVYFKVAKQAKKQGGGTGKGQGQGQGNPQPGDEDGGQGDGPPMPGKGQFDMHLDPGAGGSGSGDEDEGNLGGNDGPPQRSEQEWQQAIAAAAAVGRAQGKLPAAMELMFGQLLEPKVDWKDHIRSLISRKVGSGGYDFRRPDRRLIVRDIVAPGRSGYGANLVVIGMDSSGSIFCDPTLIDRWLGELGGIMEDVAPKEVHVVWCDAAVKRVDTLTDPGDIAEVQRQGASGGGGTSFIPVFDYITEHDLNPDCLVYLTDGDGSFPAEAPRYAVIWGDITNSPQKYPWGDVVCIPVGDD